MISIIESGEIHTGVYPQGVVCLYTRRKILSQDSYKEFHYYGPVAEVDSLALRCKDLDMLKVDELLEQGKSFEEAVSELEYEQKNAG